jgi:endonuclease/exonuclease/phosphatase family metal-dependent hydrolase
VDDDCFCCDVRLFDTDILAVQEVDGDPADADLTALTQEMPVSCRDNQFTEFIDHIVVEPRVLPWVGRSSSRQVTERQADKVVWGQLSDHCPVLVELWVR